MSTTLPYRQRGAASVVAVAVFGTAAVIVATLSMFLTLDFSRLRNERDHLQQQQNRLAAIATAMAQLKSGTPANTEIPFPDSVTPGQLQWTAPAGPTAVARLTLGKHTSELTFTQRDNAWELTDTKPLD